MAARLFVIDGSPAVRRLVEQVSTTEGYEVHAFQDGPSALQAAKTLAPKTVIADFHLDKITFSSFCKELGKVDSGQEPSIVSLVGPSDKVDEKTYRSLGVAVFLSKPLEAGSLLETLRALAAQQKKKATPAKGKRTWPPTTTGAEVDDENETDDSEPGDEAADTQLDARNEESPSPSIHSAPAANSAPAAPTTTPVVAPTAAAPVAATASIAPSAAAASAAPLESASKSLMDALAVGVIPQVTQQVLVTLPDLVAKAVERQLASQLNELVSAQLAQTLPNLLSDLMAKQIPSQISALETALLPRLEQQLPAMIRQAVDGAVSTEMERALERSLPKAVRDHVGTMDTMVRETVTELATPLIRDAAETGTKQWVDERLTTVVREQVGNVDRLVQEAVREAADPAIREQITKLVTDTAQEQVSTLAREIVPSVAETMVTAEIKRLEALD